MDKASQLFLSSFTPVLLGLTPCPPAFAFDGHDGGFDGAWDNHDDAGNDGDESEEVSRAEHDGAEGQGDHERDGHHHANRDTDGRTDEWHHEKEDRHIHAWPAWGPGWGIAPAFGGFGVGGFGVGGFGLGGFGPGGFSVPGFGGFGYGAPYYPSASYDPRSMYSSPIIVPSAPQPVYIQRQNPPESVSGIQPGYWHYCREPEGYYPQVQECPDGWEQVAPQTRNDNRSKRL